MCGISGFVDSSCSKENGVRHLNAMSQQLNHRGPDDQGLWFDEKRGIGIAHRRLSIVDLSFNGHQPMQSKSGRYIIAFNGEIYNFRKTRKELQQCGYTFKSKTDTEVFLESIDSLGLDAALNGSTGMFSFVLWDTKDRVLTLACDRMGEKPLYYGWQGKAFLFGSELKALRAHPLWQGDVERDALSQLLRYNYIPAPQTIYTGISKLTPGSLLRFQFEDGRLKKVTEKVWWSFANTVMQGLNNPFRGSKDEAIDQLDRLLHKVIDDQRVADVPLGAFLSGGIDSSTVVGVMQALSDRPVRTFTIGYNNKSYDESKYAKSIANHLGTEHEEWIISSNEVLSIVNSLPDIYDEPFSDMSQLPTVLISQLTSKYVTVSLSGDGGDELFGGYNRHIWAPIINQRFKFVHSSIKRIIAVLIQTFSPKTWDELFKYVSFVLPSKSLINQPGEKLYKIANALAGRNEQEIYSQLIRHWPDPIPVIGGASQDIVSKNNELWCIKGSFSEKMMRLDTVTYLPGDILVKLDRAAMHTSLETRIPFLDHRIVEFSSRLPLDMKFCEGEGKWILRKVLDRYIPRKLVERPKSGFGIPINQWLRGPLRDWADELLSETRMLNEGYFDVKAIRKAWKEHLAGNKNQQHLLWGVLMFQLWLSRKS